MLKIVRPPSDAIVHNPWNYGPMVLYSGNTLKKQMYTRPLYVASASSKVLYTKVEGRLAEGELTEWGDRPCTHAYYDGFLVACNEMSLSDKVDSTSFTLAGKEYTALAMPGVPVLEKFLTNNKGDFYPRFEVYYNHFSTGKYAGYKALTKDLTTGKLSSARLAYVALDARARQASGTIFESGVASFEWLFSIPKTFQAAMLYNSLQPGVKLIASKTLEEIKVLAYQLRRPKLDTRYKTVVNDADMFGELAQVAVDRTSYFSSNGFEMISEADTLFSQFTSWVPKGMSLGNLAGSYLGYTYGPATTLRELAALAEGIKRSMKAKACGTQATRSTWSGYPNLLIDVFVEYHYKIVYSNWDQGVLGLYNKLETWGLAPKMESAWDMVPLSFVFDWFFDLGNLLGKLDTNATFKKFDVVGVTRSKKSVQPLPVETTLSGYGGWINYVLYEREVQKTLDKPPLFSTQKDFRNLAEASALIIRAAAK